MGISISLLIKHVTSSVFIIAAYRLFNFMMVEIFFDINMFFFCYFKMQFLLECFWITPLLYLHVIENSWFIQSRCFTIFLHVWIVTFSLNMNLLKLSLKTYPFSFQEESNAFFFEEANLKFPVSNRRFRSLPVSKADGVSVSLPVVTSRNHWIRLCRFPAVR